LLLVLFAVDAVRNAHSDSGRDRVRKLRVTVAGFALLSVAVWGLEIHSRRKARRDWQRALHVAVILLEREPLSPTASDTFASEADAATRFLAHELRRRAPGSGEPFWLHMFGPLPHPTDLPNPPPEDSLVARALHAWELNRALRHIDDSLGLPAGRFDMRLYVLARPPASARGLRFVEGFAQAQGEVGFVRVDLDEKMAGTAWSAVLHELLHLVGAQDKYDARGRALVPDGLADPAQTPLFPQLRAEIMAGDIPLDDTRSRLPKDLSELSVGDATASEIGWLR
jgi:hypothetical protein